MAIPPGALTVPDAMDPTDSEDFVVQFGSLLKASEGINTFTLTLLPEAVALGLVIVESAQHGPFIADNKNLLMRIEIDPAYRTNAAFNGGALLPIEITINTNATPPRRLQRTLVVRVQHL